MILATRNAWQDVIKLTSIFVKLQHLKASIMETKYTEIKIIISEMKKIINMSNENGHPFKISNQMEREHKLSS